jgi:glycosyltransferase involved in cell wall biosynthesis
MTPWPPELDPGTQTLVDNVSSSPLPVTALIAAYNRETLVARALAGVAAQRPAGPSEVIVVDDASTDRTADVARGLGARVVALPRNSGAAAARNAGLRAASQPWIALLDSDDEWLPHHLAVLWAARNGHVLVTASLLSCGPHGDDRVGGTPTRRPVVLTSPANLVYPHNFVASSGVLVRRDVALAVGGFRTDLRLAEDFDLWLRVLEEGSGVALPAITSLYHRHEDQKSNDVRAARVAQRSAIDARRSSAWWSAELVERRAAVDAWDDLRAGRTSRRAWMRWIVRSPSRLQALAGILLWRARQRRRTSACARDGGPVVALLPGTVGPVMAATGPRPTVDLRRDRWPHLLWRLARRPTAQAVVPSRPTGLLMRSLGIEPIVQRDAAGRRTSSQRFG